MNRTLDSEKIKKEFIESYDKYSDAIFRYCLGQTSDREKALDLAQETFTRAWQYLAGGKQIEQMRPFLYKTATNAIIDDRRKKKTVSLDAMMEEGFDAASGENEQEQKEITFDSEQAIKLLQNLDEKYKDVLMLRYVDEMSIKEISEITNESENNISVRIHRGLDKLEKLINSENNKQ